MPCVLPLDDPPIRKEGAGFEPASISNGGTEFDVEIVAKVSFGAIA